ncbi:MAG: hypothetical protein WCA36_16440, partial [Pseudolabrys sp.]
QCDRHSAGRDRADEVRLFTEGDVNDATAGREGTSPEAAHPEPSLPEHEAPDLQPAAPARASGGAGGNPIRRMQNAVATAWKDF